MPAIPENTNILLRRNQAAEFLTEAGFPITKHTLASFASQGGGPAFMKYGGKIVFYRREDLLAWAHGRMSEPMFTASERKAVA